MILIKTNDKWEAVHAVINTWLKDPRKYCNTCGATYQPEIGCCNEPMIGTNWDFCHAIKEQNKVSRDALANDHGAMRDTKQMRWGVSIPPDLYYTLENYMKQHGYKGLFEEVSDLNKFMRKFPLFAIAKKV